MLYAHKQMYKQVADLIPNWQKLGKSDLINKYIEYEHTDKVLANSYAAAIIYKYWALIDKYYRLSMTSSVDKETCCEWLADAFLYTVKHRKWKDSSNKLYTDINAPDKVLNRCMNSERHIFYQSANYDCRKANYNSLSIQNLQEQKLDYMLPHEIDHDQEYVWLKDIIKDKFDKKLYLDALIIDAIIYSNVFSKSAKKENIQFSFERLVSLLKNITKDYLKIICDRYELNSSQIDLIYSDLKNYTVLKLKAKCKKVLSELKQDFSFLMNKDEE